MDMELRRPSDDRVIGGVCGGLGRYFGIDATLIRLAWVLFTAVGGSGFIAYVLAWLIIPDEAGNRSGAAMALVLLMLILVPLCVLCGLAGGILGAIAN